MTWSGTGTFNPPGAPDFPAAPGDIIYSSRFNNTINALCAGMGNTLTRDGQSAPTANLPMGGFRHTGVQDAVSVTDYASYGQVTTGLATKALLAGDAGQTFNAKTLIVNSPITGPTLGIGVLGSDPTYGTGIIGYGGNCDVALYDRTGAIQFYITTSGAVIPHSLNVVGLITATGGVTGNVTGNVSGSSGSCTGNAATATTASACSGNAATATTATNSLQLGGVVAASYATTAAMNAAIAAAAVFAASYESAPHAMSIGTPVTFTHGLGGIPRGCSIRLRCVTAEFNYSIGDEIELPTSSWSGVQLMNTVLTATSIIILHTGTGFVINDKTSTSQPGITLANWNWVARAWR